MDHDAFTTQYVGPVGPLVMSGDIERGDYERLLAKIADDPPRFLSQNKLILASGGGDIDAALKIGRLIKALHTEVSVGPLTGKCVGACFLIYVAADQRGTDGKELLGIHGMEQVAAPAVRDFLRENEVPEYLATAMTRPSSPEVYWLTERDELAVNTQSPSFARYLAAHCQWDPELERQVRAGTRPLTDIKDMWACRSRLTQSDAKTALAAALQGR